MKSRFKRRLIIAVFTAVPVLVAGAVGTLALAMLAAERTAGDNLASWVQAIGSIAALLLGGATLWVQRAQTDSDAEQAARDLARSLDALSHAAFVRLTDRLKVAVEPGSGPKLELREYRTTEMIEALRGLDVMKLPANLVEPYIRLRSCLYAVNRRVQDAYDRGGSTSPTDLMSAVRSHVDAESAVNDLNAICEDYGVEKRLVVIPRQIEHVRQHL